MRKLSREVLFKMVFAYKNCEKQGKFDQPYDELLDVIQQEFCVDGSNLDADYIKMGFESITKNAVTYDAIISERVPGYKQSRIFNADMAILNIALFEHEFLNLDKKIIISEALKLAKKYSTEQSIKFINGILAMILKDKDE